MAAPVWAAKVAATAIKNPEETKNLVVKIIFGIIFLVLIICAVALSMVSSLVGEKLDDNFNISQTKVYQKVEAVYPDFIAEITEEIENRKQQIIEENTYYVVVEKIDSSGVIIKDLEARCDIEVVTNVSDISYAYIFAYVNHIDDTTKMGKEADISKSRVVQILRDISYVEEIKKEDTYYLYNVVKAPDEVAAMYFNPDSNEYPMYLLSFELYGEFLNPNGNYSGVVTDGVLSYGDEVIGDILLHDSGINVPHYFQTDYKRVPYGGGTISSSGCAPTCLAMIVSQQTETTVSPVEIVKWTGNRYYVAGAGSSWNIFPAVASNWGISCKNLGKSYRAVVEALEAGKPVIASMSAGIFTRGGHFIVLRGVTSDGYFLVNDPNRGNFNKYQTDRFSTKTVIREAKNFWCFG